MDTPEGLPSLAELIEQARAQEQQAADGERRRAQHQKDLERQRLAHVALRHTVEGQIRAEASGVARVLVGAGVAPDVEIGAVVRHLRPVDRLLGRPSTTYRTINTESGWVVTSVARSDPRNEDESSYSYSGRSFPDTYYGFALTTDGQLRHYSSVFSKKDTWLAHEVESVASPVHDAQFVNGRYVDTPELTSGMDTALAIRYGIRAALARLSLRAEQ